MLVAMNHREKLVGKLCESLGCKHAMLLKAKATARPNVMLSGRMRVGFRLFNRKPLGRDIVWLELILY